MFKIFKENLPNSQIYADMPHILTTSQRPDIVIVLEESKDIVIVELTVPFETNLEESHRRKVDKYSSLVQDIQERGYTVSLYAVEVGVRGLRSRDNKHRMKQLLKKSASQIRLTDFFPDSLKTRYPLVPSRFFMREKNSHGGRYDT